MTTTDHIITVDLSLDIRGHELTVRVEYEEPRKYKVDNGGFRFVGGIVRFDQATFRTEPIQYDIVGVWSDRLGRYVPVTGRVERLIEEKLTGNRA